MRKIALVMRVVNWLIVVLLCLFVSLLFIQSQIALDLVAYVKENVNAPIRESIIMLLSMLLDILNLIGLIGLGKRKYLSYITFNNPKGTVMVSISALQEALSRALLQNPQVHEAKVSILVSRRKKKPIRVIASGALWEANDIVAIESRIQDLLEKRFKEILTVKEKVVYDIRLDRFKFEKGAGRPSEEKPLDLADEPTFKGIQYPIDEEEANQ